MLGFPLKSMLTEKWKGLFKKHYMVELFFSSVLWFLYCYFFIAHQFISGYYLFYSFSSIFYLTLIVIASTSLQVTTQILLHFLISNLFCFFYLNWHLRVSELKNCKLDQNQWRLKKFHFQDYYLFIINKSWVDQ